ncbi:MAG: hypothetical protein EHM79_00350 [Geobacter sp.]|nr:MAG: hypothetical protein EHM79_00350 [Geobacter sp.]
MKCANLNLRILQGSNFEGIFTVRDAGGNPVDLTGYEARLQARELTNLSTVLFRWLSIIYDPGGLEALVDPVLTMGGAAGTISVLVIGAVTAAYSFTIGSYDLEVYDVSGNVYRVCQGYVELSKEVTR